MLELSRVFFCCVASCKQNGNNRNQCSKFTEVNQKLFTINYKEFAANKLGIFAAYHV